MNLLTTTVDILEAIWESRVRFLQNINAAQQSPAARDLRRALDAGDDKRQCACSGRSSQAGRTVLAGRHSGTHVPEIADGGLMPPRLDRSPDLRHFQAFFWLRVFPAPDQNPRPPTRRYPVKYTQGLRKPLDSLLQDQIYLRCNHQIERTTLCLKEELSSQDG